MTEPFNEISREEEQNKMRLERYILLAKELSKNVEGFPFPGVEAEAYVKLIEVDKEFPGFTTPTDEIIEKMKKEGIKVALGNHPESGNVYILPLSSDDIDNDSLLPRHLEISDDMDDLLKKLIEANIGINRG